MPKVAIFPGSFDPLTLGHVELIRRAVDLFDELIVAVGRNSSKQYLFSLEERLEWIRLCFADDPRVRAETYDGLTVDFMRQVGARYIVRGLRGSLDYEYERTIDHLNKHLLPDVETIYLISSPGTAHISSTIVREIIRHNGPLQGLLPDEIIERLLPTP